MKASDIPRVAQYLLETHAPALVWNGWAFKWDNARRRAGSCQYRSKVITLSRHYAALNVDERFDDIIDTILHEIAHALAPGDGHGDKWKAMCAQVGARPQRCYDAAAVAMPKGRYAATCGGCNREYRRHKRLPMHKGCYCTKCGPDIGKLDFVDTAVLPALPTPTPVPAQRDEPPTPKRLRG